MRFFFRACAVLAIVPISTSHADPTPLPAIVPIVSVTEFAPGFSFYRSAFGLDLRVSANGLTTLSHRFGADQSTLGELNFVSSTPIGGDLVNAPQVRLPRLPSPPFGASYGIQSGALSADGRVVVGSTLFFGAPANGFGIRPFRWTEAGGLVELNFPGAEPLGADVFGVSDDGRISVGHSLNGQPFSGVAAPFQAIAWNEQGAPQPLGLIPGATFPISRAIDASADGSLIVGWGFGPQPGEPRTQWFRWQASTGIVAAPTLVPGWNGLALGVTPDGRTVFGLDESGNLLDVLNQDQTPKMSRGWIWTEADGYTAVDPLPIGASRNYSGPTAITSDGRFAFGNTFTESGTVAFVWDRENGTRDLKSVLETEFGVDFSVWSSISLVTSVSGDGRVIMGRGTLDGVTQPCSLYPGVPTVPNLPQLPGNCDRLTGDFAMAIYLPRGWAPLCRADFNGMGGLSVQDIFDYLSAYFSADSRADFNGVGGLTVQDIFDFLAAFFEGC